jgi:UDP-GlcNAc3NAcA epimerase
MPEEVNRVLTDRISSILYCPTETAVANLHAEGYDRLPCRIVRSGDVMEDSARYFHDIARRTTRIVDELAVGDKPFILCTFHRAENTDRPERLAEIVAALNELAARHTLILPLHPRTKAALQRQGLTIGGTVIEPIGYLEMVALLSRAALVITDSGGLQKEAYFFNVHSLTLRDETEWVELVEHGFSMLVGADRTKILAEAARRLHTPFKRTVELYGAGRAADLIVEDLLNAT